MSLLTRSEMAREQFCRVRRHSRALCQPLAAEDYQLQAMPDASPPKWHLAHTTWFFEEFVLTPLAGDYRPHHPQFRYLFNSYYDAVGARHPRPARGLLSRPTVDEVYAYRESVDAAMTDWLQSRELTPEQSATVALGCAHEEQHQELLLTDLKFAFAQNPLLPAYRDDLPAGSDSAATMEWLKVPGGVHEIGHSGNGFAFDNESPRHRVYLDDCEIASRLVTVGEYQEFIDAGGYRRSEFWLSDGWLAVQKHQWQAPLYWHPHGDRSNEFTLGGVRPLNPNAPVTHVSFYEAEAFCRFAGWRLPTEAEWEAAAPDATPLANRFPHPVAASDANTRFTQAYSDGWQWTASPYVAYPGFRPAAGALGEYNGKFMCNQLTLRGGSCATPAGHSRRTYRNFFPPESRWQFTGIRPAR